MVGFEWWGLSNRPSNPLESPAGTRAGCALKLRTKMTTYDNCTKMQGLTGGVNPLFSLSFGNAINGILSRFPSRFSSAAERSPSPLSPCVNTSPRSDLWYTMREMNANRFVLVVLSKSKLEIRPRRKGDAATAVK